MQLFQIRAIAFNYRISMFFMTAIIMLTLFPTTYIPLSGKGVDQANMGTKRSVIIIHHMDCSVYHVPIMIGN